MVLDSLGMFDAAAATPEHMRMARDAALARVADVALPAHDRIENVVVLGMGASGTAGEVVREVAGPLMSVPVIVHHGYGVPNFVDAGSLVLAVSISGRTDETVEAAEHALDDGARVVTFGHGGPLADLAARRGSAHIDATPAMPAPRCGVGAVVMPLLTVLEAVDLYPGAREWIDAAIAQSMRRREQLITPDNIASRLASRLRGSFPLVYGANGPGRVGARHWKGQCNANAKIPAFCSSAPELFHDEVAGWGQHGDITRQVLRSVVLRHDDEHPAVAMALDLATEQLVEFVGSVDEVRAEGDGILAQLLDLLFIGDLVSLHLAADADLDPGPVPAVDGFASRMRPD
mgnify:CR=1 FL=1